MELTVENHYCYLRFKISGPNGASHTERNRFDITNIGNDDIILGTDWLRKHNPAIDWTHDLVTLTCQYQWKSEDQGCTMTRARFTIVSADKQEALHPPLHPRLEDDPEPPRTPETSGQTSKKPQKKPWWKFQRSTNQGRPPAVFSEEDDPEMEIPMQWTIRALHTAKLQEITKPPELVPEQYHEFKDVFDKTASERLPTRRPKWDHAINLKPDVDPYSAKAYRLSPSEMDACQKFLLRIVPSTTSNKA